MSDLTAVGTDEPDGIVLRFTLRGEELREMMGTTFGRRRGADWGLVTTACLAILMVVLDGFSQTVLWLLLSLVIQLLVRVRMRSIGRSIPTFEREEVWRFGADGVIRESEGMTIQYEWSYFGELAETRDAFVLKRAGFEPFGLGQPLPKRAFADVGVRERFLALCREQGLVVSPIR